MARAIEKDERSPEARATSPAGLQELAKMIPADWIGQKLYLTGDNDAVKNFGPQLAKAMGANTECERIDPASGEGASAAISGLRRACEKNGRPPLILQFQTIETAQNLGRPILWKWAALAVVFLIGSFSLRYAEMFLHQGRLSKKLSEIKGYREKLPDIERDLSFLQYLKTNQPAYLEPLFALANAAPPGTRLESLSMTRRGDLSLRAGMKDSQQVVDFRSKLLESGLFSTVVVEEQTPTPDRQRIVVRMTGQWKLKPL